MWALLAAAGATPAAPAEAQYFGRNKVQYQDFRFAVLKTQHFDLYYYPEEREAAVTVGRMAERWYARLSRLLDHELHHRQAVILYASHPDFEQTNAILGEITEGTGGVTELFKRRVVLPLAGPLAETDHVLGHELAHAFQFDITGDPGRVSANNQPVAVRLPLWFIEGMAEYLSLGPRDPHTAMWMRDATRGKLPSLLRLDNGRYFPYRWGQAVWAYLAGRFGDEVVGRILQASARTRDVAGALERVTGLAPDSLSRDWQAALHAAYDSLAGSTDSAARYGVPLLSRRRGSGTLNVAPAISPDGRRVAFMSERGLFAMDIYLADAATGRVERKLTQTALDPHFQSLQFINSAGAWDPDSRRFVVGAISDGEPVLAILEATTGARVREIRLKGLGEVLSPSWSPDGRYIAFSALVAGFSDLFVYDLAADSLRRLTHDAFADLQPAWSPDGSRLAYVTDRFSAELGWLKPGRYELALLDPASGRSTRVATFHRGKAITPQWSTDGASLYFVSDQSGIANLYRVELASGAVVQLTDLYGGVSGITALSPAFSVAARTGRLVFTAYEHGDYNVYRVDDPAALAARPPLADGDGDRALLPPSARPQARIFALLENPSYGLPSGEDFVTRDYAPRLSLDYVSQPYLVIGADQFGTFIGGGAALFWSDMLGGHHLATALEINGSLHDVSALAAYTNLSRRLNWGVALQQIPYVLGGFGLYADTIAGQLALFEQLLRYRQLSREATVLASYPFNRVKRIEFGGGFQRVSFDAEVRTVATSYATGRVLLDQRRKLYTPDALNLASASAALVHDNAVFGWTSPVVGQRYRLELSPVAGSLDFLTVLADYRRYVMPLPPFTLAGRLLHYGRWGSARSVDDTRLAPLFLGYPGMVRGYELGSFGPEECRPTPASSCPQFDRLTGSKLLVANGELRFPPFGLLGWGPTLFGAVPVDLLTFYDAGVAWSATDRGYCDRTDPLDGTGARIFTGCLVSSAGVGLRLNLLGFTIAELDYVHPFHRPLKGSYWQFSFSPGF